MSYLTQHPELMLEALGILVKRAGGSVTIRFDEALGPFNLMSRWAPDEVNALHLVLQEGLTEAEARAMLEE